MELTSPLGRVTYPDNLTWSNFVDFLFCPTLCYELEYPRTDGIVWTELFYKTLAVFGCIFLLTVTSEEFIIPVLAESAVRMHGTSKKPTERALVLAETISSLLFPFMVSFLLVFLVIFEYLLGAFAEISCKLPSSFLFPVPSSRLHITPYRFRRPPFLLRLVEFMRLARIQPRMEHPRAQLLPAPRLLGVAGPHVARTGNAHHLPHQRASARARHGLHREETQRIWVCCHDAANADCHGAEEPVAEGPDAVKCLFTQILVEIRGTGHFGVEMIADSLVCLRTSYFGVP
jgi:hypothetical protein